jgi:ADP-heptose:LPS heptosyltransferase
VERIAILRANGLGDLMFALPALDALRAAYPGAEIVLLGRELHRELLEGRPGSVDRVVVIPVSRGVRQEAGVVEDPHELDRFFDRMRAQRFDLALQMHGGGRWSNPFVSRLGAGLTAGCRAEDAAPLDRWIRYVYYQPEIARYLEIAGLVGAPPCTVAPRVAVTERDRAEAAEVLGVPGRGPLAVLHPGASAGRRHWPPESFAAVGDALARDGLAVAITGSAGERDLALAVRDSMLAEAMVLCGRVTLRGLTGVLERAAVMVSNDTGPLHLANAVGTATVGIFWCGNLLTAAPLVRARHRPVASFRVACPVCGVDCTVGECSHDASFVAEIPVEEVLAGARDLLEQAGEGLGRATSRRARAVSPASGEPLASAHGPSGGPAPPRPSRSA